MIKQKRGFFQRSRIVLTALVILCGFGSFFMSMKPVDNRASRTYGVAETIGKLHYEIIREVDQDDPESYVCDAGITACLVSLPQPVSEHDLIPKSDPNVTIVATGAFSEF